MDRREPIGLHDPTSCGDPMGRGSHGFMRTNGLTRSDGSWRSHWQTILVGPEPGSGPLKRASSPKTCRNPEVSRSTWYTALVPEEPLQATKDFWANMMLAPAFGPISVDCSRIHKSGRTRGRSRYNVGRNRPNLARRPDFGRHFSNLAGSVQNSAQFWPRPLRTGSTKLGRSQAHFGRIRPTSVEIWPILVELAHN